jgi:hypothetical protein
VSDKPLSAKSVNPPGPKSKLRRVRVIRTVPFSARPNPMQQDHFGLYGSSWTKPHHGDQGDNWGQ